MAISLPERLEADACKVDELTPRQIVELLDRYVVGQRAAKRAVAIAIRNRFRRLRLPDDLVDEVTPKNILMIGPTGVGKTEISRRLSRLTGSPFLKVEATKFTEVGYVGRDVESMVRDLLDIAVDMVRQEHAAEVEARGRRQAEERLLDILLPPAPIARPEGEEADSSSQRLATRQKIRAQLLAGALDERMVEVDVPDNRAPSFQVFTGQGSDTMDVNLKDMLPGVFGSGRGNTKRRRMSVPEALEHLTREAADALIDEDEVAREALQRAESSGIIFLDEIDKIAGREGSRGPEVSREGVQRDILPIVEGTVVKTRSGMIRTDHILFLAAGAFHVSKPSDLIPELQGRFPLRVELDALGRDDLVRILTEPENSLVRQYCALLETEEVHVEFTDDAIEAIAELAETVNERTENIGARRLHTMMERVVEELSFEAPERRGDSITIDAAYVHNALADTVQDEDLSKYIL
ncbi:MAG TPA: ATP-dependent protease ATPase subunit HslU [Acidobacteriota bacterium]|nr:ATP-dependent protease ATPase subunit HslU [Acidobacteriota bacterium]